MFHQNNSFQEEGAGHDIVGENVPSATIVGRLLVIQQVLDALPNKDRIAEFTRRALLSVPGVAIANVHIHGHGVLVDQEMAEINKDSGQELQDPMASSFASTEGERTVHSFPFRTAKSSYGFLSVCVADDGALRPYLDLISNIANAIGLILEARLYQERLAKANEELRRARDELELRVAERTRELQYLVTHDRLTGLPNRVLVVDRLQKAITSARRSKRMITVIYLDLDSFTYLNTGMGVACGDEFLKIMTERLLNLLGVNDTLARIGSDEFFILLTDLEDAIRSSPKLNAILTAVREPMPVDGKSVVVTCSIGACFYPLDGEEGELLLSRAAAAMHRVKSSGKDNIAFFAESRDSAVTERMSSEADLRRAIDSQDVVLHYQPKLNLYTNKFVGVEALVRWQHPEKGLIYPSDFIPLAEDSALIVSLGENILMQACKQARAWQEAGVEAAAVAVNVAARQFWDGRFVETVRKILRDTGLDPARLELEITESSILRDINDVIEQMCELRQIGVSISIDDFGTGYSSLSALRHLPVDKLKIDRSFVSEIETVPNAAAIVLAVIAFAKGLGLKVTAEGVETAGQATFLLRQGCDEIQGYLLARPLTAKQVQEVISRPFKPIWFH
jgi:diguanylate cyclase (GGDEF)-like protein